MFSCNDKYKGDLFEDCNGGYSITHMTDSELDEAICAQFILATAIEERESYMIGELLSGYNLQDMMYGDHTTLPDMLTFRYRLFARIWEGFKRLQKDGYIFLKNHESIRFKSEYEKLVFADKYTFINHYFFRIKVCLAPDTETYLKTKNHQLQQLMDKSGVYLNGFDSGDKEIIKVQPNEFTQSLMDDPDKMKAFVEILMSEIDNPNITKTEQ